MRDETLMQVQELIRKKTGIIINTGFMKELAAAVDERLKILQLDETDYPRYLDSIHDEAVLIASRFTVQETSFYRYREHFDRLKLEVLPELIRKKQRERNQTLVIVSAGCATGEEPYTIAMILHDLLKERDNWNIRIVATDMPEGRLSLKPTPVSAVEFPTGLVIENTRTLVSFSLIDAGVKPLAMTGGVTDAI